MFSPAMPCLFLQKNAAAVAENLRFEGGQSLLCTKMHEKDYSSGMYEVMADRNESY